VATALLVAGSTLTFWIPCRLGLHSRTRTQASFKALGCSFQLTHMSRDDHAVQLIKSERAMAWRPKRRQNILKALTTLPQGWVLARKHQCATAITTMWAEPSWAFPESYTAGSCARAMADNGETKGLIPPPPKWVSAQLLYVCVTAWWRSRRCSQNLCSPFLRAV